MENDDAADAELNDASRSAETCAEEDALVASENARSLRSSGPFLGRWQTQRSLLVVVLSVVSCSVIPGTWNSWFGSDEFGMDRTLGGRGVARPLKQLVIDLNTADQRELKILPGIGPALAERIVLNRQHRGPFAHVSELTRVPGVGPKKLAAIEQMVQVRSARRQR